MADVDLTVQQVTKASNGLTPSYTAATSADTYLAVNDGRVFLHAKNTGGAPVTLTVATQSTVDGNAVADYTATIPATTGDKMIGPFQPSIYNNEDRQINVTVSGACSLAAVHL